MGMDQLRLLEKHGVDPKNVLLCHIDSKMDTDYAIRLCREGATICLDHVGRELQDRDSYRVRMITALVEAGCVDHVTLAGDMGKKNYLPAYGGKPGLHLYPDRPEGGTAALHRRRKLPQNDGREPQTNFRLEI